MLIFKLFLLYIQEIYLHFLRAYYSSFKNNPNVYIQNFISLSNRKFFLFEFEVINLSFLKFKQF
jgi:hypothetical protein